MPIYLRRYSIKRVNEYLKTKREAEEAAIAEAKAQR